MTGSGYFDVQIHLFSIKGDRYRIEISGAEYWSTGAPFNDSPVKESVEPAVDLGY